MTSRDAGVGDLDGLEQYRSREACPGGDLLYRHFDNYRPTRQMWEMSTELCKCGVGSRVCLLALLASRRVSSWHEESKTPFAAAADQEEIAWFEGVGSYLLGCSVEVGEVFLVRADAVCA